MFERSFIHYSLYLVKPYLSDTLDASRLSSFYLDTDLCPEQGAPGPARYRGDIPPTARILDPRTQSQTHIPPSFVRMRSLDALQCKHTI